MANLIVRRVLLFAWMIAFASAAKCRRDSRLGGIVCEKANNAVIERLSVYYENDESLIVNNSSIPVLHTGMFEKLSSLEKVSLSRCQIRLLEDRVFRGLNLTHLSLTGNFLKTIPKDVLVDLPSLNLLDLSHNLISHLQLSTDLNHMPKLTCVDVSYNLLKNLSFVGNFSHLETLNFEHNSLAQFQMNAVIHFPKIKEVFFRANRFNKTYESLVTFVLMTSDIIVDSGDSFFHDQWNFAGNKMNRIPKSGSMVGNETGRSIRKEIEKDFKLSPDLIKSLNPTELNDLVERILTLRNFTLNERRMLELDRERVQDESRKVKNELTRVDQIIKRFNEVSVIAKDESVGEYIEKSCEEMPEDSWWQRFKKWKCKKLLNWVKRLING